MLHENMGYAGMLDFTKCMLPSLITITSLKFYLQWNIAKRKIKMIADKKLQLIFNGEKWEGLPHLKKVYTDAFGEPLVSFTCISALYHDLYILHLYELYFHMKLD